MDAELRKEVREWKPEIEDRVARLEAAMAELQMPSPEEVAPAKSTAKSAAQSDTASQ